MRKFKCESDFMRESTRIYRAYVEREKQLNDLIAETNSLKDLTNVVSIKIAEIRKCCVYENT